MTINAASDIRLLYVTYATLADAQVAAEIMVRARLCACANILPAMQSVYWWDGNVVKADETVVLFKTKVELVLDLEAAIRAAHSYKVPCIIHWALSGGNQDYIDWLFAETQKR